MRRVADVDTMSSEIGHSSITMNNAARQKVRLTLRFEEVEDGWVQVTIEEWPEVVTTARTREDARLMALDALREYLASFAPGEWPGPRSVRSPAEA